MAAEPSGVLRKAKLVSEQSGKNLGTDRVVMDSVVDIKNKEWQETPISLKAEIFFFFGRKQKRPPGPYGPSGVLRKAKLASERSGQGDAKMAAEKKLTTPTTPNPTTPNPTPPITTHRLQAINSLVIRRPIFSKAIAC